MKIRIALILALCLVGLGKTAGAEVVIGPSGDPIDVSDVESAPLYNGVAIARAPLQVTSPQIGIDQVLAGSSTLSQFRSTITGLGYTLVTMYTYESADLSGLSAVVLYQPYTGATDPGFTPSEIAAIQAFVQGGGGLLVIADAGDLGNIAGLNQILAPHGVTYSTSGYDLSGRTISQFWYHPVTKGVGAVTVDFQRGMTLVPPALDMTVQNAGLIVLTAQGGGDDFLAVREGDGGTGNVVCVTDSNMWRDAGAEANITMDDNRLLLQNVVRYILGDNPYDCSSPIPALFFRSVFESSTECWSQVALAPVFVNPVFSRTQGGIGLSPNGSAAVFGYWNSPVLSVVPGGIYVVTWTVNSTTTAERCPQFRLRINDANGRDALYRAIESRMAGENSPGPADKKYYIVYDVPDGVSEITLAFDLLSFEPSDDLNSTVRLREVSIKPLL